MVDAKGAKHQTTNYYAFGMTNEESSSTWQSYKYNGKEFDNMHGLNTYDYGARQHDPILARWDRMDPLSEKYYSISPYAYCANSPVMLVDPDGRKTEIHSYVDKNGVRNVHITMTGVIINNSNNNIDLNFVKKLITIQIESRFNISTKDMKVTTSINLRAVDSANDINKDDNVFELVNQDRLGRESVLANSDLGGLHVRIGPRALKGLVDGTHTRTIPHEYGHTLGLEDANLSNVDNVDLTNNLMTQTGFLSSNKVPNYKNVGTITTRQINHITEMYNNGLLNMGSAIYKTIEISYRASLRNFISLKITNKLKK